ncbi:1,4-alpha-glucan branching protein [Streptomyces polygonati]|uniref:1,4-alpha-glucan branching protein n=1 Tax=Streptomyces polygonati TaxID=1617087 RepID=A0ABV8HNG4_9ACTN
MAVIHNTTLTPSKLELIAAWLPTRPWYLGTAEPELDKAGGFRLDDPEGAVGIEFMAVRDTSGTEPVTYLVPLTYRDAPLDGTEHALLGTTTHGVLGQRWVYDGANDPVLAAQLLALVVGEAEPQAQGVSDTPDPSVVGWSADPGHAAAGAGLSAVTDGPHGSDLLVQTPTGRLALRIPRVLRPEDPEHPENSESSGSSGSSGSSEEALGHVTANWRLPDGAQARGRFAVVRGAVE